jgi:hypothetical protein
MAGLSLNCVFVKYFQKEKKDCLALTGPLASINVKSPLGFSPIIYDLKSSLAV